MRAHRFAIPFVIVSCGGATRSPPAPGSRPSEIWTVDAAGGECYAEGSEGNPPPVVRVRCEYGEGTGIWVEEHDGACWVMDDDAPVRHVPCPYDAEIVEPGPAEDLPSWMHDGEY